MTDTYYRRLEKNIGKYSWFKIFNKRVYLPLIAIQLVNEGKVTVEQLAIIAGVTSVVMLILQMPAGYIADKWGAKNALVFGTAISASSPLFYIFMPNFMGGLLASVIFFGGYVFQSGVIEAFMHDTLTALGREEDYSKVMGRAFSYGLIGNVVLIALVPATYAVNHSLPFLIGFVSLLIMVWLAISFTYPPIHTEIKRKNPFAAAKSVVSAQNIALFLFAGAMAGVANRATEYRELLFQDVGLAVALFGLLVAASSIVGAVMGLYIHLLDDWKPLTFYFSDLAFLSLCLIMIGISRNQALVVTGFTVFFGYARVRPIIFQAKLLHNITHTYKATLLSALNLFTIIGEVGAIALLAWFIGSNNYYIGYLLFGVTIFGIGSLLWFGIYLELKSRALANPQHSVTH